MLAILVMALWGSLFPMIKIGYAAFNIVSSDIPTIILFAGMRFTFSGIILIAIFSAMSKSASMRVFKLFFEFIIVFQPNR